MNRRTKRERERTLRRDIGLGEQEFRELFRYEMIGTQAAISRFARKHTSARDAMVYSDAPGSVTVSLVMPWWSALTLGLARRRARRRMVELEGDWLPVGVMAEVK